MGRITLRKLRVLIEHLPPDCALARAINGHGWTAVNYQLANLADAVNQTTRQVAQSVSTKRLPAVKPTPRPEPAYDGHVGDDTAADQDAIVSYLDSLRPPVADTDGVT